MAEEKRKDDAVQNEDVREYIELLKGLTREEKREVKGVMTGMQIMKALLVAQSA